MKKRKRSSQKGHSKVDGEGQKPVPKLSKRDKRKLGLMKIPKEEQKYDSLSVGHWYDLPSLY